MAVKMGEAHMASPIEVSSREQAPRRTYMATPNRAIVADVFADEQHAQQAMTDLQDAGFRENQIRISNR
jgi:hypothetical protein